DRAGRARPLLPSTPAERRLPLPGPERSSGASSPGLKAGVSAPRMLMSDQEILTRAKDRAEIEQRLEAMFAPEDEALKFAIQSAQEHDMPAIQISPLQGKLLQILAAACGARRILEIGALAGYSGVWLARALPADGKLISLEVSEKHAEVARASLAKAGVAD